MPLKALIKDKFVVSSLLSDEQWQKLKDAYLNKEFEIVIAQTGKRGYPRTSKLGLNHFAHLPGEKPPDWKSESPEHLYAKDQIVRAAIAMGWKAEPEYISNEGWIADVFLTKVVKGKELKLAFEVQWSPQTLFETEQRQEKYIESGVRCCWFFKRLPYDEKWDKPSKDIPMFRLSLGEDSQMYVEFMCKNIGLYDFVCSLLNGEIKYYSEVYLPMGLLLEIEYKFYRTTCWRCGSIQYKYLISTIMHKTKCGKEFSFIEESGQIRQPRFEEDIIKEAQNIAKEKGVELASIGLCYSKSTQKQVYSFYCHNCGALSGEYYANKEFNVSEEKFRVLKQINVNSLAKRGMDAKHWCYKVYHE